MEVSPRPVSVANLTRGASLAERARLADTFGARLVGLLVSPPLKPGEGLWLVPTSAVHTAGMRYPIDVLFLDRRHVVVACRERLAPWRAVLPVPRAHSCLELPAGAIARTRTECGDQLSLEPAHTAVR